MVWNENEILDHWGKKGECFLSLFHISTGQESQSVGSSPARRAHARTHSTARKRAAHMPGATRRGNSTASQCGDTRRQHTEEAEAVPNSTPLARRLALHERSHTHDCALR